jgi:hypothetical protein
MELNDFLFQYSKLNNAITLDSKNNKIGRGQNERHASSRRLPGIGRDSNDPTAASARISFCISASRTRRRSPGDADPAEIE